MDSTADDARDAKRPRLTPSGAGEVDLISGLDDDVLLRVLELLDDARDAVRTGALSRRWLRLWTRVPALRFASRANFRKASSAEQCAALERYASSVNDVLARRSQSGCAIESLSILYITDPLSEHNSFVKPVLALACSCRDLVCEQNLEQLVPASVNAAQGWIGYAFSHRVKFFVLDLHLPLAPPNPWREHDHHHKEMVLLDELSSPVYLETMYLALGDTRLRLPTTMKFASLKDLSLERIRIATGGAHLLGRLVSSVTCPLLQKLRMRKIYLHSFYDEMRLEADMLSELWIEDVNVIRSLKLRTPSLRVFNIYNCFHEMLRISAPRLEELEIFFQLCPPKSLEVSDGDLSCVRSLKIYLWSHGFCVPGHREAENDANILLLKHCSSLTCLDVTLYGQKEDVDIIKSRIPLLPHIRSLVVNVSERFRLHRHVFGVGVASLLTRFHNLIHLSLHLPDFLDLDYNLHDGLGLLCDHPNYWKSDEILMPHLQEFELIGFTGTDCELWFTKAVLTSAKQVRRVAISFNPHCRQHEGKMDAFERMLLGAGLWTSHRDTHMLTCRG